MTTALDELLAQAADDLTAAVADLDQREHHIRPQPPQLTKARRPLLMAAAAAVCVLGVAAIATQRTAPSTIRPSAPVTEPEPTPTAPTPNDEREPAPDETTASVLEQEGASVETTVASTAANVADPFAFVPAPGSVPAGFELVALSDTLGGPPGGVGLFHGIVAALDDQGVPIDPIVHIELPEGSGGVPGETTPIRVGAVEGIYRVWQDQFTGIASPQASIEWAVDGTQVAVSGPDDPDLLLAVSESITLSTDNGVDLVPPDGLVWWPGNTNFGNGGLTLRYIGPELSQLLVTTERAQPGGLYADALRLYSTPEALATIDGQPAQIRDSEWGTTLLAVETEDGYVVTLRQIDPQTGTSGFRYELDDETIRTILAELEATSEQDWDALADTVPQDQSDFVVDRPAYLQPISRVLAGPAELSIITPGEADATVPARIVLYEDSIDPTVFINEGDQAATAPLSLSDGVSAPESIEIDPDGTQTVSVLVSAGPDVEGVDLTNGDATIPVTLTESFPSALAEQRFAYIVTASGYWLQITFTDGTTQLDDLGPPGQ